MCMCGKPTINGEPGYSWDGKSVSVRHVMPPELRNGDQLLYDEPGRCGGLDSHSHHFRVVKRSYSHALLVRHGGGEEAIDLSVAFKLALDGLAVLDSNSRYWLFLSIHSAQRIAETRAQDKCNATWRKAAAEKRVKTRKMRAGVKVWIEPAATA